MYRSNELIVLMINRSNASSFKKLPSYDSFSQFLAHSIPMCNTPRFKQTGCKDEC